MFDRTLFVRAIRDTLECWPSFQMSLANGMGGRNVADKLEWLCQSLVQLFRDNPDQLIPTDVEDYLAEVLDNEFDTIIQDGSLEMVSASMFRYHQKLVAGDHQYVTERLQTVRQKHEQNKEKMRNLPPAPEPAEESEPSTSGQNIDVEMEDGDQDDEEESEEDDDNQPTNDVDQPNNKEEDNNDGWTVVRRKK